MKPPIVKSIEDRKREFLADPQAQAIIKRKVDSAIKFFETADLSALSNKKKLRVTSKTPQHSPS